MNLFRLLQDNSRFYFHSEYDSFIDFKNKTVTFHYEESWYEKLPLKLIKGEFFYQDYERYGDNRWISLTKNSVFESGVNKAYKKYLKRVEK